MQIIEGKGLLLNLRNPNVVLRSIKNSRDYKGKVLVKWGVPEVQQLHQLGIPVPSPMEQHYEWPTTPFKPFDHQIETACFLTKYRRVFCFNEQGTGKTASAIWASDFLLDKGYVTRVLVVCPVSIMDTAWKADLFKFAMHRTVDVAHGSAKKRAKVIESGCEYVIINYDGLGVVEDELAHGGFDLIIVDEATHYKNKQTERWKKLNALIDDHTYLWLLTGTPAAQSPVDAFGLAKLVCPDNVPRTKGGFQDLVMRKVSRFKWVAKDNATAIVHDALQPAIRFTKDDCLDLPDMVYTDRVTAMSKQQTKYYDLLKKQLRMVVNGEQVEAATAANLMTKLLQIAGGAVYSEDGNFLEFELGERYKALREVIDESSNKVLVFVPFRNAIEVLADKLAKDKVSTGVIQGSVSISDRNRLFKQFQNDANPRVLIIQPQAAAHGVTLTAADTVVWWSPVSSLETYLQANARVHRAGQTNKCTVVHLQGAPVETHVYTMLRSKVDIHSEMLELYNKILE